ncbi:MAG: alpha/beta hydrolase, partial [Candidatus Moraniibacteriota bacterium]
MPIERITDSVTWSENRVVNGIIVVESGATLTIPRGVTIEFDGKSKVEVEGKLIIAGTLSQPVVLKKKDSDEGDSYSIAALFSGSIVARNVDISGGGGATEAFLIGEGNRRSFLNRAMADWFYSGALGSINGGTLDVEGVYFHDNVLAVYANNDYGHKVKVWRSKFENNERDFINGNTSAQSDLRYNWWGSENGPEICTVDCDYPQRTLEKIIGGADTSLFAQAKYFKNPVIIIPGILGSWKWTDSSDFVLDPILELYDPLMRTLDDNGYEKDTDLFVFPYEWRKSNVETAKLLQARIEEIQTQTKWPRVDIVAHSMGGLVAREYIETLDGGSNVDQLITLGTPHNGSPESYLMWEGGDFYDTSFIKKTISKKIFQQEAEENGYTTIFDYLTKAPIKSVWELLPAYSYLRDQSTHDLREYPTDHPKNTFLENLNDADNVSQLDPVWFTNIVGKVDRNKTITGLRVSRSITVPFLGVDLDLLWGHGKPEGYDDLLGDHGLESGMGDGTV